ncbi:hypothetical protein QTP88_020978 [Uroleucon formosanum]
MCSVQFVRVNFLSVMEVAKEVTFVYHTILHSQSFNSMTCTSTLIRKLFDEKKFTAARTKTREVAVNVIAPFAVQLTIDDLKTVDFVSILVDAPNHKAIKLVPVIVRYFSPTTGVRNKILEFSNLPGETADLIHNQIIKVLNNFNLTEKIISYSADNTNTNFGGLQRKGKNNVFIKLKETLNRDILGMGCYAHIIHNSIQCASDCLPIDIESIVCKIFGFFHIYTVRVENLKEFCDFADIQYKDLLSHSKTRWLSLFPAIERIISIYNGLKSYFLSQNTCPNALKIFFENESSLLWLKFLSSQLKTINSYIKKVESQKLSAIELTIIMEYLMQKIENKRQEKFLTTEIENLVTKFEDKGLINRKNFDNKCDEFYALCYNYLKNWNNSNQHVNQLKSMLWITLTPKTIVTWENVKKSVQFINNVMSKPNSVTFDEETFFEQFKTFEKIFHQQNDEWHHQDIEDKWLFIFKTFADNNQEFSMLLKVVEFSFVLPGSNAAVERVFSLMNNTWTNSRNKLDIKTVEASLIIKTSFNNTSCEKFYKQILENKSLLRQVHGSAKYLALAKSTKETLESENSEDGSM